jgi:hypothetical protein
MKTNENKNSTARNPFTNYVHVRNNTRGLRMTIRTWQRHEEVKAQIMVRIPKHNTFLGSFSSNQVLLFG